MPGANMVIIAPADLADEDEVGWEAGENRNWNAVIVGQDRLGGARRGAAAVW